MKNDNAIYYQYILGENLIDLNNPIKLLKVVNLYFCNLFNVYAMRNCLLDLKKIFKKKKNHYDTWQPMITYFGKKITDLHKEICAPRFKCDP